MKKLLAIPFLLLCLIGAGAITNQAHATGSFSISAPSSAMPENYYGTVQGYPKSNASPVPTSAITINITTDNQCEFYKNGTWYKTGTLTHFQTNAVQEYTFRAVDDTAIEGNHTCVVSYTTTSADANYNGLSGSANFALTDNDAAPGFTTSSKPASVTEGATHAAYNGALNSDPTAEVTVTVKANGPCQLGETGKGTVSNFGSSQSSKISAGYRGYGFAVRAIDDTTAQGTRTCTITGSTTSADANYNGKSLPTITVSVIDNDSAPATGGTTPKPATTPSPAASATPSATPSPDSIKLTSITVAGKTVSASDKINVAASEPLVLSGTTIPNATVTLTIHSTPRTVTLQSDANGHWSYTITGLESGSHYVEASVTDPATKVASAPTKILSFNVASTTTKAATSNWIVPAALLALILLAAGGCWYGLRRWRQTHPAGRS